LIRIVIVNKIPYANKFLASIRAREENNGYTQSILFGDAARVWRISLKYENVTTFRDWTYVNLKAYARDKKMCNSATRNMQLLTVSKT
jgi:hypothetical protein